MSAPTLFRVVSCVFSASSIVVYMRGNVEGAYTLECFALLFAVMAWGRE